MAPLPFTPVEREIMALVAQGLTARAIAARRRCGVPTIRKHLRAAAAKIRTPGPPRQRIVAYMARWAA